MLPIAFFTSLTISRKRNRMRETLEVFPVAIHFLKNLSSKRPTAPGCRGTGLQEKAFPEMEAVILRDKMTTIGRICVSCSLRSCVMAVSVLVLTRFHCLLWKDNPLLHCEELCKNWLANVNTMT